jgi:uncharacterized DUF497 family protein
MGRQFIFGLPLRHTLVYTGIEHAKCFSNEAAAVTEGGPESRFGQSRYEWNEAKRQNNREKHGIDFLDAVEAFTDPHGYVYRSRRQGPEVRYVAVGMMNGALIAVVFTERGERVRIISARAARRSERQHYG